MPVFRHRDFEFEIDDEWWRGAGMVFFAPATQSYRAGPPEQGLSLEGLAIVTVAIASVEPVRRRRLEYGVFNDDAYHGIRADIRVKKILVGFRKGDALPPVQVVRLPDSSSGCTHRLHNGAHRFYCAVAAGFTHVPAIEVPSRWIEPDALTIG